MTCLRIHKNPCVHKKILIKVGSNHCIPQHSSTLQPFETIAIRDYIHSRQYRRDYSPEADLITIVEPNYLLHFVLKVNINFKPVNVNAVLLSIDFLSTNNFVNLFSCRRVPVHLKPRYRKITIDCEPSF